MSPKPFTLESILRFRKRQEELAQKKFIQKQLDAAMAAKKVEQTQASLQSLIRSLEEKQSYGISVLELSHYENSIQFEQRKLLKLQSIQKQKEKEVQQKRTILLEKMKDHTTLSTLKEQQNKTWNEYVYKKEAAMLDEIAILHHDRTDI